MNKHAIPAATNKASLIMGASISLLARFLSDGRVTLEALVLQYGGFLHRSDFFASRPGRPGGVRPRMRNRCSRKSPSGRWTARAET